MNMPKDPKDSLSDLRKKAKKKLTTQLKRLQDLSTKDVHELVQELGTHQIELEMQNEELRRAQDALEGSRGRYADLYDFAPIGYFTFDRNGVVTEVNLTGAEMLGTARHHLLGKPIQPFVTPADRATFLGHLSEVFASGARQTAELGLRTRKGATLRVMLESVAGDAPDGGSCRTAMSDITDRHRAEEALRKSENLFRLIAERSSELIFQLDLQGELIYVSPAIGKYGFDPDKILQTHFSSFILPADLPGMEEAFRRVSSGEEQSGLEARLLRSDGTSYFAEISAVPVRDNNRIAGIQGISRDITERKEAEESLRNSEEKYRLLFRNMAEGFALYELLLDDSGKPADWRVLEVNDAYTQHTGISRDRIEGRRISELFPAAIPEYLPKFSDVVANQKPLEFETYSQFADRHLHVVTFPAGPGRFASTFTDISERKRTEEALRESEQKLRLFIEHSPAAIAMVDRDMNYLAASRRWYTDYHVEDRNIIGRSHYSIFPDTPEYWKDVYRSCLAGAIERKNADPWTRRDGTTDWIRWEIRPWRTGAGEIGGLIIFSENITALKKTELALQTLNDELEQRVAGRTRELQVATETVKTERQRLFSVLETLPVYVILLDKDHRIPFANRFFRDRFGESKGRRCHEYLFNRSEPCENCDTYTVMKTGGPHHWYWTGPDNRDYDIYDFPFVDTDGSSLILEMGIDITDQKRARQALQEINETLERRVAERTESLRQTQEDLARAQAVGQIGSWRLDINSNVLTWSEENHSIFGLPQGTPMTYETFLGTIHPDDRECVDRKWKAALAGEPYDIEHRIIVGDRVKWVREKASLEFREDGALLGGFGITQDITERKRIEDALRLSSDRYRSYIEVTGQLGWTTNAAGEVEDDFPLWRAFTGQSKEEVRGWGWSRALHPEDLERTSRVWRESVATKSPYEAEYRVRRQDGVYRYFLARGIPLLNDDGNVREWVGTCIDITERKQSEDALRTLNAELEMRVAQRTRFYAVLAQVNEAIVRSNEPQVLFNEVCRIIVETGGFRLAWIGLADPETREVRPVASCGSTSYLEGIRIVAADVPESKGPTGRAIVEERPVVNRDFESAPELAPWRDNALKHELRSSSSFPLRQSSSVIGALTIYSDQPGFFTDEEVTLLRSLAEDISYAIETLALEKKKLLAEQSLRETVGSLKEATTRAQVTSELLSLITQKTTLKEYLDATCGLLHAWTGLRHVGIRVAGRNHRAPFEACLGYEEAFLEQESELSLKTDQCICTRIIAGTPDPADRKAMTAQGSFFSGDSLAFMNTLSEEERGRYRGVCMRYQFRSLAIIPIPYRETTVGSLHLADERRDMVSPATVQFLEQLARIMGEAVFRFGVEEERARLASAVESTADGVVITSPDGGRIEYVNRAFEHITGYTKEEAIGNTLRLLDGDRDNEAFFRELRSELPRDGVWRGRLLNKKKDGTLYFEDCTFSPVLDQAGNIINYVSIKRDITEKLQMETMAESVSAMDNIGTIFAGVRHEIGNPINNAKMMLTVLQQKLDSLDPERVRYYVDRSLAEILRVEHLLATLRSFNLFEAPTITDLRTGPLLDLFRDLMSENLKQRGVAISLNIRPGAETVRADSRALQHVLLNLVTNAADAMRDRRDPRIDITVSREHDRVRFQVSDCGSGMTDAQIANLFKPFHTTKPNGTGLGLVIVKKMLTVMNGSIEVTSRLGEGTVVNVDLPAGNDAGQSSAP